MRVYLLIMAISAAMTYLLVPLVHRLAIRVGAMTAVRSRDVHTLPTPRMGGLAMYLGFLSALLLASKIPYLSRVFEESSAMWGILIGAGVMCAVGVLDDIIELVWYAKLAGEMLAAGVMAWFGVQFISMPIFGLTIGSARLTLFVTVLFIVLVANAVNFIDGLDGLAAGVVAIAAFAFFGYSYYLAREASPGDYSSIACTAVAGIVGMCLGFLPHNFHPSTIFMGDSGALTLGALIAGASIVVTGQIDPAVVTTPQAIPAFMPILVPILIIIVPVVDFVWAVVRRLAAGRSPFSADAGHLHHRLLRHGHSHRNSVLILYMWTALVSFSAVAFVMFDRYVVAGVSVVGLVVAIVLTRAEAGRRRRTHRARAKAAVADVIAQ